MQQCAALVAPGQHSFIHQLAEAQRIGLECGKNNSFQETSRQENVNDLCNPGKKYWWLDSMAVAVRSGRPQSHVAMPRGVIMTVERNRHSNIGYILVV